MWRISSGQRRISLQDQRMCPYPWHQGTSRNLIWAFLLRILPQSSQVLEVDQRSDICGCHLGSRKRSCSRGNLPCKIWNLPSSSMTLCMEECHYQLWLCWLLSLLALYCSWSSWRMHLSSRTFYLTSCLTFTHLTFLSVFYFILFHLIQ